MTVTDPGSTRPADTDAPRVNRHGSACPGWCQIDHAKLAYNGKRPIDTHISAPMTSDPAFPRVVVTKFSSGAGDEHPEVQLQGIMGFVMVSAGMAGDLADLVESLAGCTPQRLRELADEVRQAGLILAETEAS
jgi:hypothetical protein